MHEVPEGEGTIRVVFLPPFGKAEIGYIKSDLKSLQEYVGGYIEAVYPWADNAALVCNEEGKLIGLPCHRILRDDNGVAYDIIAGNCFVCGLGDENFASLTDEQCEKYARMFLFPDFIGF